MTQKVRFQKLDERAMPPAYGSAYAAGADLCAVADDPIVIPPHQTFLVRTGLAVEIPEGFVGLVCARSGLATKQGLAPANKVGVVDSDYRGEIKVGLVNQSDAAYTLNPGERFAQLVISPVVIPTMANCRLMAAYRAMASSISSPISISIKIFFFADIFNLLTRVLHQNNTVTME